MHDFDLQFVRNQFPAFAQADLHGWAFFENAGGSYPCRQTIARLRAFYEQHKVQPYGAYPASQRAGEAMDQAYARFAELLNVEPDEVHFGPSTSQNTYVLAQAFRAICQQGDEIIVTDQDHEANSGAWRRLAEYGVTVREWQVDPKSGRLDLADLHGLLGDRTRLVAFPHCSNIVGEINPVAEITQAAHQWGAQVVVDGVAYAPHGIPDVASLDADIYLFSLYKTYGPHLGLMYVRRSLAKRLTPQCHFFNATFPRKRLLPAGPDHAQIAAATGVAEYFDALRVHHRHPPDSGPQGRVIHDLFRRQETNLLAPLLQWLQSREDIRIVGPTSAARRAPTISIIPRRATSAEVRDRLVNHKIMAASGHFYAVRLLSALGIDPASGVLRMSFVHYTSPAEIDQLIHALDQSL